ncbi:MAG: hypothetical protein ACLSVD_19220, partial [Eggerthellaceae bacterium]
VIAMGSLVENCWNKADVSGNGGAGGIAYNVTTTLLVGCWNSGSVSSSGGSAGGLAGRIVNAPIERCYNIGEVRGADCPAGGLVGDLTFTEGIGKITDCFNRGKVSATGVPAADSHDRYSAGGLVGYHEPSPSSLVYENCYNAGEVTAEADSYALGDTRYDGGGTQVTFSNCYYDSSTVSATGDTGKAGLTGLTTDAFKTGQVAWLLDHPDAGGAIDAAAIDAGPGNGVWGQKLVHKPLDGSMDTTPLVGGEVYPDFWDGTGTFGTASYVDGTDHPAVARVDYGFEEGMDPAVDAVNLFLNRGGKVMLAGPSGDEQWKYFRDADFTNEITNRLYDTATETASLTGGYPVYVKTNYTSWADVGKKQTADKLKNTYWDDATGAWVNDGTTPAPGLAALEGDATSGFTIRSEEAFAWWAYQVTDNVAGFRESNVTLAPTGSHTAFDFAGTKYGGSVDESASESTVDQAKAKYQTCLPWVPITEYSGTLEANGMVLRNLDIKGAGLFVQLTGATVKNLHVGSGYLEKYACGQVGMIVGLVKGSVRLEGCENAAAIYGDLYTG